LKVFLLYPPVSREERYSSKIGSAGGSQIPLGIYCIAAYLRDRGHAVKVVDGEGLSYEEVMRDLRGFSPDWVGISSTTVAFHRAVEIAKEIKKTGVPIVLGGPHVTSNPQHAMSFPCFDYGVRGEGELPAERLLGGENPSTIEGISWRDGDLVVVNKPSKRIQDLDTLPLPAYDLIPNIDKYTPTPFNYKATPVVTVNTSRGCPYECTFCDNNTFGRVYRELSAERVVTLLRHLKALYDFKEVAFVDDTFMINKKRLHEIFERLEFSFKWTCMSRVNVVDDETIRFSKKHGLWRVAFGLESGDDGVLKAIKKGITTAHMRNALSICNKAGVKTTGFFMVGHPTETLCTIEKTKKLALELPLDDIVVTINTPIPGSPQYATIENYGTLNKDDWSKFNYWRPVFVPNGLTKDILVKKHREIYRGFYLRPKAILKHALDMNPRRLLATLKSARFLFQRS